MSQFKFDVNTLRGDVTGGLTAGIVALPLALAFGVQSGLGAIAGLYGAIALGIFASLFWGYPDADQRTYGTDDGHCHSGRGQCH